MKTKQLPQGWIEVELGELFTYENKSGRKAGEGSEKGKYKFFTSSSEQTKFINEFDYDGEHIIFSTGGQAGIHYINEKFSASNDCFIVKVDKKILTKYVYYYLSSKIYLLEEGFKGVALRHISKNYLNEIKIVYPENKETQKHIVQILEGAEALKQKREDADKKTAEYLRAVFYEMFGDPNINKKFEQLDFEDCLDKSFKKKEKIPQQDFLKEGKYPIIDQGENLIGGFSNNKNFVYSLNKPVIIFGDHTRIFKFIDFDFAQGADGTRILMPISKLNPYYFYHCLKLLDLPSAGYSRHLKFLKEKKIPLPPLPLQQKFAKIVEHVEKLKEQQRQSKEKIEDMFNVLMQKAFKGELVR